MAKDLRFGSSSARLATTGEGQPGRLAALGQQLLGEVDEVPDGPVR